MKLVIVESPTKAKTIGKFLGKEFRVESSYGHVRDLPKSRLGIDVEHDFEPQYIVPLKARANVKNLKKLAEKASSIILATDEDREGEAIAWHLMKALELDDESKEAAAAKVAAVAAARAAKAEAKAALTGEPKKEPKKKKVVLKKPSGPKTISRIVFHEITPSAIESAIAHPRDIDLNLVDAQQARRILDRLVGYKLSPFLWKKVVRGLSAGRVQSVALRLIADREAEILKFKPEEYWTIGAKFGTKKGEFEAALQKINGKAVEKLDVKSKEAADKIVESLKTADYQLGEIEKKENRKNPLSPFTTSTLQQSASQRIGFSAQKTMFVAQRLYENGHITYMRTDSVNISEDALVAAKKWIGENLGDSYVLPESRKFKNKSKLAQEAHEAIRPTHPEFDPMKSSAAELGLEPDEKKLYELIWRRFIASQMPQAIFDAVRVEVIGSKGKESYELVANGTMLQYDGFLKVWPMKFEEKELPALEKSDPISLIETLPAQHFTEPPPRFNEASLIKTLEKYGIGRPSTYAPIISVIQGRNYVEKLQGRFVPTEMGTLVNNVLTENFPQIVDIQFTATMEGGLDAVAEGKESWRKLLGDFYFPFAEHLEKTYESVAKIEPTEEKIDVTCELCGKPMIIKFGRFGKFIACTGFPDCKNTKKIELPPKLTGVTCPDCLLDPVRKEKPGELVERKVSKKGRARGKVFWGCNLYPACKYATWTNPAPKKEGEVGTEGAPSPEKEASKGPELETFEESGV
jgi:DNA topoisomerase I